jgi:hypothetical protein
VPGDGVILTGDVGQEDGIGEIRQELGEGLVDFETKGLKRIKHPIGVRDMIVTWVKHAKVFVS